MRKRDHNIVVSGVSLVLCGLLAGVVIAAAFFPAMAIGGIVAKASADSFGDLPTELDIETPPPQITDVYANDGETLLARFYEENRKDIPLSEVPQVMLDAIIAAEDQKFYQHKGVDWKGVVRAFAINSSGNDVQGASTLTMQYVRNQITYTATSPAEVIAATEDTMARKIREVRLALVIESKLTKDEILERYLNISAFGHGAYGIYAASQVFFDKEPEDLTLEEAALLAALPKAPSDFDPATEDGRPRALERRNWILDEMADLEMITPGQRDVAKATEIKVTGNRTPNGCIATMVDHWGFFCDYFYRWWVDQEAFGATPADREARLKSGGYKIITTLDAELQASAKGNVEEEVKTGKSDALMVAAIEPGTGRVKALATNRRYSLDDSKNPLSTDKAKAKKGIKATYPNTTNPLLTGGPGVYGYKSGSAFKLFTMVTALEQGYTLDYQIATTSPYHSKYPTSEDDLSKCSDGNWCPKNAGNHNYGLRNMWTGFGASVNTYFVPLQEKVGADKVIATAEKMGIQFRDPAERENVAQLGANFGPFTLGVTGTVPLELANAYATVAADGKYCEPTPALQIFDRTGEELPDVTAPRCEQVIAKEVARAAIDAARCPINDRGGLNRCNGASTTGAYFTDAKGREWRNVAQAVGYPVFGKTGTSDYNWTANLVVSTKQLAVAATIANPDMAKTPHDAETPRRANRAAAHTLRDGMKGLDKIQFAKPPDKLVVSPKAKVPDVTCQPVDRAEDALKRAGFEVQIDATKIPSDRCKANEVAETNPAGGKYTSKGTSVVIRLANGKRVTPEPPETPPTTPPEQQPTGPSDGGGDNGTPTG